MKYRIITVVFLMLAGIFIGLSNNHAVAVEEVEQSPWDVQSVTLEGSSEKMSSIALDSKGYPHMAFFIEDKEEFSWFSDISINYAHYDGNQWNIEKVSDIGHGTDSCSIEIDADDIPHICYTDWGDVKYAVYREEEWEIEEVMISDDPDANGDSISFALDSEDHPHISCSVDYFGYDLLKYAHFDGNEWKTEEVDNLTDLWHNSIAMDSKDRPHIAYDDERDDDWDVKYAYNDGNGWNVEIVDDKDAWHPSIALDSEDRPHISYNTVDDMDLKYAYHDENDWDIEIVDDDDARYSSIALDSSDTPHIVYHHDMGWWGEPKYAYNNGKEWINETVETGGWLGLFNSIAIDKENRPHITYEDYGDGDLRYAFREKAPDMAVGAGEDDDIGEGDEGFSGVTWGLIIGIPVLLVIVIVIIFAVIAAKKRKASEGLTSVAGDEIHIENEDSIKEPSEEEHRSEYEGLYGSPPPTE